MDALIINGGNPLKGELAIHGSKNAILPILAACILTSEQVCIHNVPHLADIDDMLCIMQELGIKTKREASSLIIDCSNISSCEILDSHVGKIRSSVVLMGAVIARMGTARIAQPGGCDIGKRPIDMHIHALQSMGVEFTYNEQFWNCKAANLKSANITLPFPSVGATENIMLAAAMAPGTTVLYNAAAEPEIEALQNFINLMGGEITGAGTPVVRITGKRRYHGCEYTLISDRIVAGTYMLATAAAGGDVTFHKAVPYHNAAMIELLQQAGVDVQIQKDTVHVSAHRRLNAIDFVKTAPYPGFPTDLQPPLMAVLATAKGVSTIQENIYENRFRASLGLVELGANIEITVQNAKCSTAIIRGVEHLQGTTVNGTDLRCNAALVVAALGAKGTTTIKKAHYINRGYEHIVKNLKSLGADIAEIE